MTKQSDFEKEMAKMEFEQLLRTMFNEVQSLRRHNDKLENDLRELSEKKASEDNLDDLIYTLTISDELTPSVEKLFDNFSPNVLAEYLEKNENFCALAVHCPIDKYMEYHPNPEQLQDAFEKEYASDYQVKERTNRAIIKHLGRMMIEDIKQKYNLVERNEK